MIFVINALTFEPNLTVQQQQQQQPQQQQQQQQLGLQCHHKKTQSNCGMKKDSTILQIITVTTQV